MWDVRALGWLWCVAAWAMPAGAQVRCTMPNGKVIEQRLAATCPNGAIRAETLDGQPAPIRAQSTPVKDKVGHQAQTITRQELGAAWPLTAPSGVLRCVLPDRHQPHLHALLIEVDGQQYTLNGVADAHAASHGWRSLAPIWRANPEIPGTKVPIGPLITRAGALCAQAQPMTAPQQPAESEHTQARELCDHMRRAGASECKVSGGFLSGNEMEITAAMLPGQMRDLCDTLKLAARTRYRAMGQSARGWQVKIYHPAHVKPTLTCAL